MKIVKQGSSVSSVRIPGEISQVTIPEGYHGVWVANEKIPGALSVEDFIASGYEVFDAETNPGMTLMVCPEEDYKIRSKKLSVSALDYGKGAESSNEEIDKEFFRSEDYWNETKAGMGDTRIGILPSDKNVSVNKGEAGSGFQAAAVVKSQKSTGRKRGIPVKPIDINSPDTIEGIRIDGE